MFSLSVQFRLICVTSEMKPQDASFTVFAKVGRLIKVDSVS